ncbi:M55 family metallopeptidase [Streptomyces roseochromogenus]|uniref:M55 family metallopeptidase n=1 Tax=Streptomyces roseochromogenus TaxID=285450 RepID=UPI00315982E2
MASRRACPPRRRYGRRHRARRRRRRPAGRPVRNLLPEALHPAVRLVRGKPGQTGTLEGLTSEYDAVLGVGHPSRAAAPGVLSHSFMGHEWATRPRTRGWTGGRWVRSGSPTRRRRGCPWWPPRVTTWRVRG